MVWEPAGATGLRVSMRFERDGMEENERKAGGHTDELGRGVGCHASGSEETDGRYSHEGLAGVGVEYVSLLGKLDHVWSRLGRHRMYQTLEGFTPQPATPLSRPLYYNSTNSRFDIRTPHTKL